MDQLAEWIVNLDRHLGSLLRFFGPWTYLILFTVLLAETGLVLLMVLPGDELIFVACALASRYESLNILILLPLFAVAAFCGDQVSYLLGRIAGRAPLERFGRSFGRKVLARAEKFYDRHGGRAIIFGRFVPVVRGVLPFSAAVGGVSYPRFLAFSLPGTLMWTSAYGLSGYYFGRLPFVREHFVWVLIGVAVVSLLPLGIELSIRGLRKLFERPSRSRSGRMRKPSRKDSKPARAGKKKRAPA